MRPLFSHVLYSYIYWLRLVNIASLTYSTARHPCILTTLLTSFVVVQCQDVSSPDVSSTADTKHNIAGMDSQASPPLLRPLPRRPTSHKNVFHLSPTQSLDVASGDDISPVSEGPSSPTCHSASTNQHSSHDGATSPGRPNPPFPPQKTRSILNLTASTLFGIYSGDSTDSGLLTPFGTGSHTPARGVANNVARRLEITTEDVQRKTAQAKTRPRAGSRSVGNLQHNKPSTRAQYMASMLLRVVALFAAGVAYGIIVMRLHESRSIAPVELQLGVVVDRSGWWYLGFWGLAGVVLGSLLPSIDHALAADSEETFDEVFPDEKSQAQIAAETANGGQTRITYLGAEWNPLVRSVGAFVGIAFAIVSMPSALFRPPPSLCFSCESTNAPCPAPSSLAIYAASLPYPRACQPLPLVPYRPLPRRLLAQQRRRRGWCGGATRHESGHRAGARSGKLQQRRYGWKLHDDEYTGDARAGAGGWALQQ